MLIGDRDLAMGQRLSAWRQKKNKNGHHSKIMLIVSVLLMTLLAVAIGWWLVLNHDNQQGSDTKKITIALVNEDHPANFEGVNYQFGRAFVERVSNDNKYNWQVVSRAVADKAYDDGAVQGVIYLSQDFTKNILTLQATDPQKAQISYKVLNSNSELSNSLLTQKVNDALYQFNTAVVQMYYTSVAGNVASAQSSMKSVINSQGNVLSQLNSNILSPFQMTNQGYSAVTSLAGGLKATNDNWIQAQNSFTKSVTSMLDRNSLNYSGSLPKLDNFFTMQRMMMKTNLDNANVGIQHQATIDQKHYFNQYKNAHDQSFAMMQQFMNTSSSGKESGVYTDLKNQVGQYNQLISQKQQSIQSQTKKLQDQQKTLFELEKQLYRKFFNQDVDPTDSQTDFSDQTKGKQGLKNAKQAMTNLLLGSFDSKDNISGSKYEETIKDLLVDPTDSTNSLSVNPSDYSQLLTTLSKNGSLSKEQKKQYEQKLEILKNYANEHSIKTPSRTFFRDIPTSNTNNQSTVKTITVKVPASSKYTLSYRTNKNIADSDVTVDKVNSSSGQAVDYQDVKAIKLDNSTKKEEQTYKITYRINLQANTEGDILFEWGDETHQEKSQDIFSLVPANSISEYAGGSHFGNINRLFSNIDTATSLVTVLYGKPGASYQDMIGVTDFVKSADENSIFKRYGNVQKTELSNYISDQDVASFRDSGLRSIQSVTKALDKVKDTLSHLNKDQSELQQALPDDYFSKNLDELNQWYQKTQKTLDEQLKSWTRNDPGQLNAKDWSQRTESELALYSNDPANDSLYQTITNMVDSTAKQSKETANQAQMIKSNANEFEQLVKDTNQTQDSAKEVINNTGSLLTTGQSDLNKGNQFYNNFSTLMGNTRSNQKNNGKVFNFFAQPIQLNNQTPKAFIKSNFDWRPIILTFIGLIAGLLSGLIIGRYSVKKAKNSDNRTS